MSATNIEWCDVTWNPIVGCKMVSPGCAHCYAETMANRIAAMAKADIVADRKPGRKAHYLDVIKDGRWNGQVALVPEALADPFKWKKPRRVFVNSMSDLFHEDVPFEFVDRVFAVMAVTTRHTYQILTKRPERMAEYLQRTGKSVDFLEKPTREMGYTLKFEYEGEVLGLCPWPLRNVWIGTSVENQKCADERIPHLLRCPASVRFLSCEPLLQDVNLCRVKCIGAGYFDALDGRGHDGSGSAVKDDSCGPSIDWVIVGGESGHNARPCNVHWIRAIVAQCKAAGVACFVKQLGSHIITINEFRHHLKDSHGGDMREWSGDLRVREFPNTVQP